MKQITQFVLSGLGVVFNTKWRELISPIETPSLRYVRKLRTQHTKSTSGREALKETLMRSRILDPEFVYVPAAKTDLRESMVRYKAMVENEGKNTRVRPEQKKASNGRGVVQAIPNAPADDVQSVQRITRVK
jgi:hypothetical protein